jgi:ABC-type multidrug transport system permease subunit
MIQQNLYKEKDLLQKIHEKKYFMMLVFLNLILQSCIVYYVFKNTEMNKKNETMKKYEVRKKLLLYFLLVVLLMLVFFFISIPSWVKFILFCSFSYLLGSILAYLPDIDFFKLYIDSSLEKTSIVTFIGLFCIFFIFFLGFSISKNSKLSYSYFLLYVGIFFLGLRMITTFDKTITLKTKCYMILIFTVVSLFMIYDSYNVLHRDYHGDFVSASFDYLTDPFLILNKNLERLIFL